MKKLTALTLVLAIAFSSSLFAASYKIDASHSEVGFKIKHLGISNVRGEFTDFGGHINWEGKNKLSKASFEGKIEAKSINTQNEKRDDHLRSKDFFNVKKNPEITFKSKDVVRKGRNTVIIGDFTMNGVTREIELPVEVYGPVTDPWGNEKLSFEASTEINRKDYNLNWNKNLDKGGVVLGEEVKIELSIAATKQ
jgi:polyisoprenoid-binding protein YceI